MNQGISENQKNAARSTLEVDEWMSPEERLTMAARMASSRLSNYSRWSLGSNRVENAVWELPAHPLFTSLDAEPLLLDNVHRMLYACGALYCLAIHLHSPSLVAKKKESSSIGESQSFLNNYCRRNSRQSLDIGLLIASVQVVDTWHLRRWLPSTATFLIEYTFELR